LAKKGLLEVGKNSHMEKLGFVILYALTNQSLAYLPTYEIFFLE